MSHLRAADERNTLSIAAMQRGSDLAEQGNHDAAAVEYSTAADIAAGIAATKVNPREAAKWALITQLRRKWAVEADAVAALCAGRYVLA